MHGVLAAELAVFAEFKSVRIVSLVLCGIIVSLLAFRAGESNFDSYVTCHTFGTS